MASLSVPLDSPEALSCCCLCESSRCLPREEASRGRGLILRRSLGGGYWASGSCTREPPRCFSGGLYRYVLCRLSVKVKAKFKVTGMLGFVYTYHQRHHFCEKHLWFGWWTLWQAGWVYNHCIVAIKLSVTIDTMINWQWLWQTQLWWRYLWTDL